MIFLGDLPKPIHGMSNVNAAVLQFMEGQELKPKVINSVPSYAASFYGKKAWLLFKILHTFFCYLRLLFILLLSRHKAIYRPINGGVGQIYDLLYLMISRLFFLKIYIHHHSFQYLNKHSLLFSILNRVAGKSAIHIVLGMKMSDQLHKLYGIDQDQLRIVSNLAFFGSPAAKQDTCDYESDALTLGHLANLSVEKGVDIFIDICRELKKLNVGFNAKIAGPFADDQAEKVVMKALDEMPEIHYTGSLYGDDKSNFYASLDCFVFPSKYVNEAEPLVLYEAGLYGVYLAGTQRGCMQDVIKSLDGFSIDEKHDPAGNITRAIYTKANEHQFDPAARARRRAKFQTLQLKSKELLASLIEEIRKNDLPETQ